MAECRDQRPLQGTDLRGSGGQAGESDSLSALEPVADPAVNQPKVSHAVLLTSAQLSRGLLRVLFVIAVARVLGPGRFGLYAVLLATIEMFAAASGSGYTDYLTREAARDERTGWGLGEKLVWLRLTCIVPLVAIGLGILWLLSYPRLVLVASAWMSVSLVPRALSEAVQGVLRGIGRYVAFLVVELALGLTLVAGAVLLLVRGGSLRNVIESEIAAAVAAGIAALFFALKYRTKQRIQLKTLQLLKTSGIFNIYAFVGNLYDRVDVLMLSKLAGNYATGIYGAAYRPIGAIQLLPYGILYSLLPTLTRGGYSQEEGARLEKAMGLLLSAAYAIVLTTTAFAVPAVRLLLGAPYAASAVALKILIWAVILRFINYAFNIRLLAGGHERVFVVTSLVCLAVNFVGNLLLIPIFSWRAAAAITVITEAVLLVQNAYWLRRTLGTIPRPFGWARTSLVFAGLWLACLAAARVFSPILVGIVSLVLFLIYLYRTGMIGEFAAAWRQEQPQGLQGGLSFVRAKA